MLCGLFNVPAGCAALPFVRLFCCRLPLQPAVAAAHAMSSETTGQRALALGCSAPAPSLWSEPQLVYAAKPAPQSPTMCSCGTSTSTSIASTIDESRSLDSCVLERSAAGSRRHFVFHGARHPWSAAPRPQRCCWHSPSCRAQSQGAHVPRVDCSLGICCCPCFRQQPCRWPPPGTINVDGPAPVSGILAEACHVACPPSPGKLSLSASFLLCGAMGFGAMHWDRGTLGAKRSVLQIAPFVPPLVPYLPHLLTLLVKLIKMRHSPPAALSRERSPRLQR